MSGTVGTHWLRPNHVERSPHRLLIVDTETAPNDIGEPDRQSLRYWCAKLLRRHGVDKSMPRTVKYRGRTAAQLCDLIESLTRTDHALWTMTHNLNFDLAVTELPVLLTDRGWTVTQAALTTDDPWIRLSQGHKRITVVDSWSYLPQSVTEIGRLVGLPKLRLPAFTDNDARWWARCERDVDIVAIGISQLMDWWDAGKFGNWSLTGPSTGWSSFRHFEPSPHVLVEPDDKARAFEARAITGGRRDARRVGKLHRSIYADLDIATAHLTVMSEFALPMRRVRHFSHMALDDKHLDSNVMDVMAEVEIQTGEPRYPWNSGQGIFYPAGRFHTILAGPEIREARARGELCAIGEGYIYLLGYHMQSWARWLASLLAIETPDVPPTVRLAAKHWSRCVPGKWAGHTSEVISRIPDPRPGWEVERGVQSHDGSPIDLLRIGGELWTIQRDLWGDDSFPAILAWIQSHTRVAISRLIDRLGMSVVTANTDGVVVDVPLISDDGEYPAPDIDAMPADYMRWLSWRVSDFDTDVSPFTLKVKAVSRSLTVISPQHLIMDKSRKLAGIPASAKKQRLGTYSFTQWPALRVQLIRGGDATYTMRQRSVSLSNVPPAGWLDNDGRVWPLEIHTEEGFEGPVVWHVPPWGEHVTLAPIDRQHPFLRKIMA